jgi:hypothetical protein
MVDLKQSLVRFDTWDPFIVIIIYKFTTESGNATKRNVLKAKFIKNVKRYAFKAQA